MGWISLKPKIKRVVSLSREASRKSDCYIGMSAVLVKKNQSQLVKMKKVIQKTEELKSIN